MAITRDDLRDIRNDINAALASVAAKHGLRTLAAGNASFTGDAFTIKLDGIKEGGLSKEAQRYQQYRAALNLPPLKSTIEFRSRQYRVEGMNTTGSKVMISLLPDEKGYQLATDAVARCKVVGLPEVPTPTLALTRPAGALSASW